MHDREATESSELLQVVDRLHTQAAEKLAVAGTQIWVADDLGFQLRACIGRTSQKSDRACAHRCCLDVSPQSADCALALPIDLGRERSAACVFALTHEPDVAAIQRLGECLSAFTRDLDEALQGERIARISGTARLGDHLRACLALAHGVEHCAELWPVLAELHQALGNLMPARNFFVSCLDETRSWLRFEYYADEYDDDASPIPFREGRLQGSLSAFVVAAGRIVRGSSEEVLEQAGLSDTLENRQFGTLAHDWIGVPIMIGGEVLGIIAVQSYQPDVRFQDGVPNVLAMIAEALGAALHRRRQREALERTVAERTEELSRSLTQLHAAQKQLVEAEKLASLGQLVAGVAHEVNTPLGVALTAVTHLSEKLAGISERMQGGTMRRKDLEDFLANADEVSSMTRRNLERAAHLVQSFKQVSVDRTSDGRREFELGAFLDELERSSHSLWKQRPIQVSVECAQTIGLDSFPGPLGQVLTNLIQNALLHAFPPERSGQIRLTAHDIDGERFEINVIDDGLGIEADVLPRIFEPFFTTKRNRGGTGLGLQIVANLISQKLGGQIEVDSTPGHGTTVRLRLPRVAPAAA